ncbi:ATP-binding protein [Nonomuraea sp. NPDC050786]|uniref:ATP-binding protein n=1 Tax=Nonomuraea sp. NPDC050786 TaxID=3154840 RepID=UPI0033E9D74A
MTFELRCPISPDLRYIRELVRIHGEHHGLNGEQLEDLVLVVNEAVTNVLDHGGKAGRVTARGHGHGVILEILDVGGRLTPEHLAAATVDPTASHGFGLWVIQHLCDDVTLEDTASGSVLSLHFRGRPAAMAEHRAGRGRVAQGSRSTRPDVVNVDVEPELAPLDTSDWRPLRPAQPRELEHAAGGRHGLGVERHGAPDSGDTRERDR